MKALERRAWGALNPVLAFGLVLAVLVVFYLGETLVDHEHIREHERLHMQQEIVQLQSELTQLQHAREADKEQNAPFCNCRPTRSNMYFLVAARHQGAKGTFW